MEALMYLLDAALVAGLGAWMAVAVADNWRHPSLNREAVATVVRLDLLAEMYPDDFRVIAHRRIERSQTISRLFHLVRLSETLAALALLTSALLLVLAAAGGVPGWLASGAAALSTVFFVSIWSAFLIGGNYFAYWYCHQWAQSNHFMLMFWGILVLLVILL